MGLKRFKPIGARVESALDGFDWSCPFKMDRDIVERALSLNFLSEARNLNLVGPNGLGNTMIAQNICHTAV